MSLLVDALHHKPVVHPPVWLMRQAGRYLPEYRAVRAKFPNFIQFCLTPDAATEVSVQPVTRFGLDAAIIFADILTIPHALGHTVTFSEGHGPNVQPITHPSQLAALESHLPEITPVLAPVSQTIRQTRAALPHDKAVIGFSGCPFTLACYMLDTKPSLGIPNLLAFAAEHPQAFTQLIHILTRAVITYLSNQISAGASAVQLFESWAIACPPKLWQQAVHAPILAIAAGLKELHPATPIIAFPRGATHEQLAAMATVPNNPLNALSLATETNLQWATQNLQPHLAIQGNLNPDLTVGETAPLIKQLKADLDLAAKNPGYIVNLGHGLTPQSRIENVQAIVDVVHAWRA